MKLEICSSEEPELHNAVVSGVREYNISQLGNERAKPLLVTAKTAHGELAGGSLVERVISNF